MKNETALKREQYSSNSIEGEVRVRPDDVVSYISDMLSQLSILATSAGYAELSQHLKVTQTVATLELEEKN